jgi:hypothetical protein
MDTALAIVTMIMVMVTAMVTAADPLPPQIVASDYAECKIMSVLHFLLS